MHEAGVNTDGATGVTDGKLSSQQADKVCKTFTALSLFFTALT